MADVVGSRLKWLIEDRGSSQSAIARALGVSQPTIGRLISGETPETGKLLELARLLKTSPEYIVGEVDDDAPMDRLADGRSGFRSQPPAPVASSDTVEIAEFDVAYGLGASYIHDGPVRAKAQTFSRKWLRNFTDSPFENLMFARGIGDSMMPTILDSDLLLIDTAQQTPRVWDHIWAIDMGGMGMVKRLRPAKDGGMRLISSNPDVPDETAYDGEMVVIGRVVAVVRKM